MNIVATKQGSVKGVSKTGYTIFRGIPYAKPPVGDLRWKPPVTPDAWEGIRDATAFGSKSIQMEHDNSSFYVKEFYSDGDYMVESSEDCLYLNIWTPEGNNPNAKLPVAFWIHGGAFVGGNGGELEFDGKSYCERGVILVTINYRLGALGFLAHKWLTEESGISGNYGIYDQLAALDWVRENIAAFGGDGDKITIFGQSAGAMSVQALVSSELTEGKIAGAILQSGGGYKFNISSQRTLKEAEAVGDQFAQYVGAKSLADLRALPVEKILEVSGKMFLEAMGSATPGLPFAPCIDGALLKQSYDKTLEEGRHLDIHYMLGSTANDLANTPDQKESGIMPTLHNVCVEWSLLNESLGREPNFVYYFSHPTTEDELGAFHSFELWYMFGTLGRSWRKKTKADYLLSEKMLDHWCNFIKTGDPNVMHTGTWYRCKRDNMYFREFV